jgi:hypothetical protein
MNPHIKRNQSAGNKIATYITRAIICLFGIGLLIIFIVSKIWKTTNFKVWMTFGALIGLCVGYGIGGDIWGARLFDLFTGRNIRRLVEKAGESPSFVIPKATLLIVLAILVSLLILLVRFVWYP